MQHVMVKSSPARVVIHKAETAVLRALSSVSKDRMIVMHGLRAITRTVRIVRQRILPRANVQRTERPTSIITACAIAKFGA